MALGDAGLTVSSDSRGSSWDLETLCVLLEAAVIAEDEEDGTDIEEISGELPTLFASDGSGFDCSTVD